MHLAIKTPKFGYQIMEEQVVNMAWIWAVTTKNTQEQQGKKTAAGCNHICKNIEPEIYLFIHKPKITDSIG